MGYLLRLLIDKIEGSENQWKSEVTGQKSGITFYES